MMIQTIIRPLYLLMVTILLGCSGATKSKVDSDNAVIVEHVLQQPSSEGMITKAKQAIDSIAMLPIDTLSESSYRRLPNLIKEISKALKERNMIKAAATVAAYPYGVDAEQNGEIAMRLLTATLLPGTAAPAIKGLSQTKQRPRYTVVLFHESACRTCQGIVWELKERYVELQQAGVRIVSVSTDTNESLWEEYAASLPWPDKLCDLRGFQSPVMEAYGVAATPTMYLIDDSKGLVTDQYMTVEEIVAKVMPTK